MSRQKHEVLEIISKIRRVVVNAADWSVEDLEEFAFASCNSDSKLFIKYTHHLTLDELVRIIMVKGDHTINLNLDFEL